MSIVLDQITKRYGNQLIVDRVSLEVSDGELFVLLGASGSGKSTILRMIAGLVTPDSGRIHLHGRDVTELQPQQRGTGFVFQNYSIFRHMSVAENIEFGLKIRKMTAADRKQRRERLLDLVGLGGLGNRYASQLSGGQQQRVALARALAYEPGVLLLDEPFGALDVKIRAQLRRSLKEIQRNLGVTTILVTHDQEEAFELADRIAVLERGRLLEVGEGEALYSRPRSLFVATFLGAGTVLVGHADKGQARFGPLSMPIPDTVPHEDGAQVQLLFRPEQVTLSEEKPPDGAMVLGQGTIIEQSFTGSSQRVRLRVPRIAATRQVAPSVPFGEEGLLIDAIVPPGLELYTKPLWVSIRGWHILKQPPPRLMVFDNGSESSATLGMARWLVERLRASATLLTVAESPEAAERLREKLKQRQQQTGLTDAELRIRFGDAAEQIAAEQNETLYEVIMLAPKIKRFSVQDRRTDGLGTTTAKVLKHAEVPVLLVKGAEREVRRILICTAAGEPGKSDVRVGGRLARRLGAAVTLLYITKNTLEPGSLARTHLDRAVATLRAGDINGEVRVREAAAPADGILAEASEGDYDLIVVGGHVPKSRSVFRIDNVTMQVMTGADRPVLVVPTADS